MGTHPIFESDFDCLTDRKLWRTNILTYPSSGSSILKNFVSLMALRQRVKRPICKIDFSSFSRRIRFRKKKSKKKLKSSRKSKNLKKQQKNRLNQKPNQSHPKSHPKPHPKP